MPTRPAAGATASERLCDRRGHRQRPPTPPPALRIWAGSTGRPAADVDTVVAGDRDRTTAGVLAALTRFPSLSRPPGTAFAYSNAGYVCLAATVERAADRPLPEVARDRLFGPLGMADTCFWSGPPPGPPGSAPLAARHPAPLSLGDGGLWSTADDLLRWNEAMNTDALTIAAVLQRPGRLDDGTLLDYAWGVGVRTRAGHRVYRHGGGWPGLRLLLARVPDLGVGIVIIAPGDDTERRGVLDDALLDMVTGTGVPHPGGIRSLPATAARAGDAQAGHGTPPG